jgi:hypothetical protein
VARRRNGKKTSFSETFRSFRAERHQLYIYRQYTNIVFILQQNLSKKVVAKLTKPLTSGYPRKYNIMLRVVARLTKPLTSGYPHIYNIMQRVVTKLTKPLTSGYPHNHLNNNTLLYNDVLQSIGSVWITP